MSLGSFENPIDIDEDADALPATPVSPPPSPKAAPKKRKPARQLTKDDDSDEEEQDQPKKFRINCRKFFGTAARIDDRVRGILGATYPEITWEEFVNNTEEHASVYKNVSDQILNSWLTSLRRKFTNIHEYYIALERHKDLGFHIHFFCVAAPGKRFDSESNEVDGHVCNFKTFGKVANNDFVEYMKKEKDCPHLSNMSLEGFRHCENFEEFAKAWLAKYGEKSTVLNHMQLQTYWCYIEAGRRSGQELSYRGFNNYVNRSQFIVNTYTQQITRWVNRALENTDDRQPILVVVGPPRIGKTHFVRSLLEGFRALYMQSLVDFALLARWSAPTTASGSSPARFLVLDDLQAGARQPGSTDLEPLKAWTQTPGSEYVATDKYVKKVHAQSLPTVILSNVVPTWVPEPYWQQLGSLIVLPDSPLWEPRLAGAPSSEELGDKTLGQWGREEFLHRLMDWDASQAARAPLRSSGPQPQMRSEYVPYAPFDPVSPGVRQPIVLPIDEEQEEEWIRDVRRALL